VDLGSQRLTVCRHPVGDAYTDIVAVADPRAVAVPLAGDGADAATVDLGALF